MNPVALVFFLANAVALTVLPRRLAILPLITGACYMTLGQGIELGPFSFPILRMLITTAVIRVLLRGERIAGGANRLDRLFVIFSVSAIVTSIFHNDPAGEFVFRLGLCYNICGIYFLIRIFCNSIEDVVGMCRATAIILAPVAVEMLLEKTTAQNFFSVFGGVPPDSYIRDGKIRAQGPFQHPILAGTVGGVCLPLMISLWRLHRREAFVGIVSCIVIVMASASSGPIMTAVIGTGALLFWRFRSRMALFRKLAVVLYLLAELIMKDPAYYLMARIDLTGSSASWHRAHLIESAFKHSGEWWLAGTDYTRHWMPTGVSHSEDHTDITNYYIKMGVIGGFPLMFCLIAIFIKGFRFVGVGLRRHPESMPEQRFLLWALGASLFAHAATCLSVSYFDQSFLFLYVTLGCVASVAAPRNAGSASDERSMVIDKPTSDKFSAPCSAV